MTSAPASRPRRARILAIGDELVTGQTLDTNSAWLARELGNLGFDVRGVQVVSDGEADLVAAMRLATADADLVICTGGLGPTEDDRTRAAAARLLGVDLVFDPAAWEAIEVVFATYVRATKRVPAPTNRRQAMFPAGARVVANRWGSAPGFECEVGDALLITLPGVPREMRSMWTEVVVPRVQPMAGDPRHFHCFQLIGFREAELGERIASFMAEGLPVQVGITATSGQLTVRASAFDPGELAETVAALRPRFGDHLIYEGAHTLAFEVGGWLRREGITFSCAESCTGGLVAAALTEVPGISEVFETGFVTYSNAAKESVLGVPAGLLAAHGAVSLPVVEAMAAGACRRSGARAAVAVSGVAGPGGGTEAHPVGTVCFGVQFDGKTASVERRFGNLGRELVRSRSVREALLLAYRMVRGLGLESS